MGKGRDGVEIFVMGATGFVGGSVAERLSRDGHKIRALAHSDEAEAKILAAGYEPVKATLSDIDAIAEAMGHAGAVVWSVGPRDPSLFPRIPAIVEALVGTIVGSDKPFLYVSTGNVYADSGTGVADEDAALGDHPMTMAAIGAERAVLAQASDGVRGIVVRPGVAYGRGRGAMLLGLIGAARASGSAAYVGAGNTVLSTVHVDDLADLVALALESAPPGTVLNAAAEPPVSTKALAEAVARAAGVGHATSLEMPQAMQTLGYLAMILGKNTGMSAARAKAMLGWEPSRPSIIEELTAGSYAQAE